MLGNKKCPTGWIDILIHLVLSALKEIEWFNSFTRRNKERTVGKPPVPVNVTLTKGSVHVVATRKFVDYVVFNNDSLKFREWVKDTDIPDETYFSSLNHSPQLGVPGSYLGKLMAGQPIKFVKY